MSKPSKEAKPFKHSKETIREQLVDFYGIFQAENDYIRRSLTGKILQVIETTTPKENQDAIKDLVKNQINACVNDTFLKLDVHIIDMFHYIDLPFGRNFNEAIRKEKHKKYSKK